MSLLHGKMEIDRVMKAEAAKFHDLFGSRPHHASIVNPGKIQSCELHDGDWGRAGSTISWNYVHDGEVKFVKNIIDIDDEKNAMTFRIMDGDMMKLYKNFVMTVEVTQKDYGSSVRWILDYEKLSEDVPEPFSLLEMCVHVTRDICQTL